MHVWDIVLAGEARTCRLVDQLVMSAGVQISAQSRRYLVPSLSVTWGRVTPLPSFSHTPFSVSPGYTYGTSK